MADSIQFVDGSQFTAYGALADRPVASSDIVWMSYVATDQTPHKVYLCLRSDNAGGFSWFETTGGGASGGSGNFVYRQGAVNPVAPVFGTWAEAYQAAKSCGGAACIVIDDSLGNPVTTPGTYDLDGITLSLWTPDNAGTLTIAEGTIFQNLHYIGVALTLLNKATATSPIQDPIVNLFLQEYAGLSNDATATVPLIALPVGTDVSNIDLVQGCRITGAGAAATVNAEVGQTLVIGAGPASVIDHDTLGGDGDIFAYFLSPSASISADQTPATSFAIAAQESGGIYHGRADLTNGVSAAISVPGLGSASSIVPQVGTPVPGAGNLTVNYGSLEADRVLGLNGTFKITALKADGTKNALDQSLGVSWVCVL